jgi:ribosome-binding ATPase
MRVGLVGLPGSGKTTVFGALTGLHGAHGRANLGVVKVPDPRVDRLSRICQPKKTTYAEIAFADLPAEAWPQMREPDALVQVVRGFAPPCDPAADMKGFSTELNLMDLILVDKRLDRLKKEKGKPREDVLLGRLKDHLEADRPVRTAGLAPDELSLFSGFRFLSEKPLLRVLNVDEQDVAAPAPAAIEELSRAQHTTLLVLSGKVELEIAELPPAEQADFARSLGLAEPALFRFIRSAYAALDLVSFFTVGPDEVRAWTVGRDARAQAAAGKIHSDLERGFIRAEVTRYEDFVALGSEARCREAGKLRMEGKDYPVKDGDILHVRFAV